MLPYCALAGNRISQGENRNARKLVLIDCESAQRRRRQLGNRLVVDADDADVAGHNHTNRVERLQHADRDDVRRNNNCVRQCAVVVTDKLLPQLATILHGEQAVRIHQSTQVETITAHFTPKICGTPLFVHLIKIRQPPLAADESDTLHASLRTCFDRVIHGLL